jgi:uncharacterized protein YndB with AHSA1/START domain
MPITVSTLINAPAELVWECYTNPNHIVHWNFASPDWCCPSAQNDLRIGGRFNYRMEARDGSVGFNFEGEYTDILPEGSIKYTLADGRAVEVYLERKDGAVETTHRFDPENQNPEDMQRDGWQMISDNFKQYVENLNNA